MSGSDDLTGEMPAFPLPRRDGVPPLDGATLDRLLRGAGQDDQVPPEAQALAELLAAARGPARAHELVGESAAVAAFVEARRAGSVSKPRTARRRSVLATILSTKLAAAAVAGTVTFGGVAAAAYAGALPEPIQDFAHQTVGAPAADTDHDPEGRGPQGDEAGQSSPQSAGATGPDPTGAAMYGLCTAFAEEKAEMGYLDTNSPAFMALAKAAGGAGQIDEFCADVVPPSDAESGGEPPSTGATPDHPTSAPTGVPSTPPTDAPSTPAHPTGPPIDPPSE